MASQAEIHEMVYSRDTERRKRAAAFLREGFGHLEDKEMAWEDLQKLSQDEDNGVRWEAAKALGSAFGHVPDKDLTWKDLHRLTQDEDWIVREYAASALGTAFKHVPDKLQAWQDLHRLTQDEDWIVRDCAARALGVAFNHIPDKLQAWQDLHRLAQDEYSSVLEGAAVTLGVAFGQIPDKSQGWKDLHTLTQDDDANVRDDAALALGVAFNHIPDKLQAGEDLHRLTQDEYFIVRTRAADALGAAFNHIPDKTQAWQDLHKLTQYENIYVRACAAHALGMAFNHIPDKDQAWKDLHRLAQDEHSFVLDGAAGALGTAFNHIPDKDQAWKDLHKLAQDDNYARCTSYHSLGRISILKATESDDDFKTHLEEAIEFFRRSSEEANYFSNPAAFCLPFYRSLHSLLFTEVPKEDEVKRYINDAKDAIEDSESKEALLEAVNNLSKALQEVRDYSIDDVIIRERDLKSYTKYCLKTAECLKKARYDAPLASKMVEMSIPIVDQKIKALFRDVEVAAGKLCKSTKGTDLEAFGRDTYESTRGLNKVESWIAADQYLERIVPLLRRHCSRLPKEAQEHLKTLVDSQDNASLEQRLYTLESVLLASLVQGENDDRRVIELKGILDLHLQSIEFAIINMKESSGNARKELYSLKNQIDGLQREIESQGLGKKELSESLEERDRAMMDRLNKMREDMIKAVRDTARLNADKRDIEAILKEIDNQDRLKKRDVLGIITDISSLAGMALTILL